ncbi:MAG: hypothetical protein IJX44_01085 [Bacteroidaceae bacterium]|nr:hypothetical protein [Bacteroidaceae bacterium]
MRFKQDSGSCRLCHPVGAGTATLTATAGSKSADCQVTVKQKGGGVDASIGSWGENETYEGTVN